MYLYGYDVDTLPYDTKEFFTVLKNNSRQIFKEIGRTIPKYHQSIETLEQGYVDAWRSAINSTVLLEQQYAKNTGFLKDIPESAIQMIYEMTSASIKAYHKQNQMLIESAKTTRQVFETFNENTQSFSSLNKEIMEYLISTFEKRAQLRSK